MCRKVSSIEVKHIVPQLINDAFMELKKTVNDKFLTLFGKPGVVYASAGRINLIGEHTDYNGGFVFPGAIDKVIMAAIPLK